MKFNIIPSPKNYDALPDVLKKEAENQYARLKDKLSYEEFYLFDSRADFKFVLALSDFIANTIFSYPKECAALVASGALDSAHFADFHKSAIEEYITEKLSEFDLKKRLRVIRRTRAMVIAWRDLTGVASIDEVFHHYQF